MRRVSWRVCALLLCLALLPVSLGAQSAVNQARLTSATCPGSGCLNLSVTGVGGVGVQVTGTFSGTLTFEGSLDGVTYTTLSLTPINSTTAVTTATAAGVWSGGVGGLSVVRVRMSSYTSGTATVTIQNAPTSARGGGGGGATIGGSIAATQVAFGSGVNTLAGSADLTFLTAGLLNLRHGALGADATLDMTAFNALWNIPGVQTIAETLTAAGSGLNLEVTFDPAANITTQAIGAQLGLNTSSGSKTYGQLIGMTGQAYHHGTGNVSEMSSFWSDYSIDGGAGTTALAAAFFANGFIGSGSTVTKLAVLWGGDGAGYPFIDGTVTNNYGAFIGTPVGSGTITNHVSFWSGAMGGRATNAYGFWQDEAGVFRVRADNTFNAVYQAIPALYNPQFTKYTPGAANYERLVFQWESNVGVLTTENGGTGTLRALRIGDAGVATSFGGAATGTTFLTAAMTSVSSTSANSCGTTSPTLGTGALNSAGTFTVGATSGTDCTLTFSQAAPHFWTCGVADTTTANLMRAVPTTTTTTKIQGVMVAADVIQYACNAF